ARPTILVTGGSLGARTLNEALMAATDQLEGAQGQVLWQCGKLYQHECQASPTAVLPNVKVQPFLDRMDLAYAAADIVICRAGALTIAELCLLGKAAILVPSPNVAEDHQTKNARALADRQAALLVTDAAARNTLITTALRLLADADQQKALGEAARNMAHPGATEAIAREVIRLANQKLKA
ncbi:MAG: UDP-N-acetylglucosamine--N-acetylmuramyl-(pentapeptide) pyrophosphoryl-undecaprenol N-acetylglucosamine transferase, partial [Lewinella sp.]|nr:UDP-N-acetylglucosamine--N-acetylmuramyl-(pentapeptide) pyrophosphoryl-undecaprenol N-acetylglucosamine transferase [Lewinella sp.]